MSAPAGGDVSSRNAFRPYTLVAELTYRCPLRCAYCSNPVSLHDQGAEIDGALWLSLFEQAEALGVVQLHLTGGEPLLRPELETLVEGATRLGLYSNLITSAVPLERERLVQLKALGLCNVQISVQGVHERDAERVAGKAWLAEKLAAARWTRELDLPLTLNVVLHRDNIAQVPELVELAERLGAGRLELANTQYLGWALENRNALLPSAAQIELARAQAAEAKRRLLGKMEILFVLPDYYTDTPRACMDGWARRYIVISPDGSCCPVIKRARSGACSSNAQATDRSPRSGATHPRSTPSAASPSCRSRAPAATAAPSITAAAAARRSRWQVTPPRPTPRVRSHRCTSSSATRVRGSPSTRR